MSKKDYSTWHNTKTTINNQKIRPKFHEREIWFANLGLNIGFEQDGRGENFLRPVLVIKKFNNEIGLIIPLTKNPKKGIHYYSFIYINNFISTAILSQIKLIDSKRLNYKSGYISEKDFIELKEKLKQLIT